MAELFKGCSYPVVVEEFLSDLLVVGLTNGNAKYRGVLLKEGTGAG